MKVLFINTVCGIGSTGKICAELADKLEKEGHEVKIAYGREPVPEKYRHNAVRIGHDWDARFHGVRTRLLDEHGFGSKSVTKEFLEWAEEYNPELVWLHNLHGYYINVEMLFEWIKSRPQMQVKWTLHDCWSFTGHCAFFTMAGCNQWKEQCRQCSQKKTYPSSVLKDNCEDNYNRKKSAFTGVTNMTITTPSQWLADLVKESFLKEYPVEVCYNTINTEIFRPTQGDFRQKHALQNKKIILGVANIWDERKGLNDFIKLAELLDDRYAIVLVGLTEKQVMQLPDTILGIMKTNNAQELAEIYTTADVFVNTTYEDNYPTVNLEAQACGTPVITYRTGGSVESVPAENVVEVGDIVGIVEKIECEELKVKN